MKTNELLDAIGMIDDDLIADAKLRRRNGRTFVKRLLLSAAAFALCISVAVPVVAANVPAAYNLLYAISPVIAQKLKPVQLSCEDNGIRMEVLSASIEGDAAYIYIALQDLKGERIDETTDLFDSYRINRPFDSSATCRTVGYDAETKTVTFLINITQWGEQQIGGSKLTFSVSRFLSGKEHVIVPLNEIDLTETNLTPKTQTYKSFRGFSLPGDTPDEQLHDLEKADYLIPQGDGIASPTDGVTVTALGYIDGKLHIQSHYEDIHRTDNHGVFYLIDEAGKALSPSYSVSFWDEAQRGSYAEEVFDISADALAGYTLCGEFWTCDTLIEGDWQVTFPLTADPDMVSE